MKKAIIIPNPEKDIDYLYTDNLAKLLNQKGIEAYIDKKCGSYEISELDKIYGNADAMIVLGGDGSILRAVTTAVKYNIPIFAVNLGTLGFIAQFEKGDEKTIADMINSGFSVQERSVLSVKIKRKDEYILADIIALNDAVITKNAIGGVASVSLLKNKKTVALYRGDGVIAATPTGSTAYSMSSGGPIIDSSLDVICVTPICAHSLRARPIVFSGSDTLSFLCTSNSRDLILCVDGVIVSELCENDIVEVTLSDKKASLADTENNGFCEILYRKMSDR